MKATATAVKTIMLIPGMSSGTRFVALISDISISQLSGADHHRLSSLDHIRPSNARSSDSSTGRSLAVPDAIGRQGSRWMRYHTQGAIEVIAQMLDQYDITQDAEFARKDVMPFAEPVLAYYDLHWQRGADGKIRFSPTQSIETYQLDAVNPTPDIAGLEDVLPRLLALPDGMASLQ